MANSPETNPKPKTWPAYKELAKSGELARRALTLRDSLAACDLCPNHCKVNRLEGKTGKCRSGITARVAAAEAHKGEERCISGSRGSGTVFFSACTMRCVYCQNFEISQKDEGQEMPDEELAELFQSIKRAGCHNLNLVTPTHFLPMILNALDLAAHRGFNLPVAYNTSGYETPETLQMLNGIVDIYLPDLKYMDSDAARRYSGRQDYVEIAQAAILEMQRQVGDLVVDEEGVAMRGLIVRHLPLPGRINDTIHAIQWLREAVSPRLAVSLLTRYTPANKASQHPELSKKVPNEEIQMALGAMHHFGLRRV